MLKQPLSCLVLAVVIAIVFSSLTLLGLYSAYQYYSELFQKNQTYEDIGKDIRSRVEIGEARDKALQAMVDAGAWYSIKCAEIENDVIYDYFYFGPTDRDKAYIFMTTSTYQDGHYLLEIISNNSDSVTSIPEKCFPPEIK